jgi:hypothetical protein
MERDAKPQSAAPDRPREVIVRPLLDVEVPRWLDLMRAHHYLGFGKSAGKRIFYVATIDDEWVALLAWAAAALHVKCRDQWLGWDKVQKRHRLHLVTNNTRFLVLPGASLPNLASRVLALNARRLGADWRERHGNDVLLAETFVDPSRFRGTCYRAAGWTAVGMTAGFGHHPRGAYQHHGSPKQMFLRPLVPDARERLGSPIMEQVGAVPRLILDVSKLPFEGERGLLGAMQKIPSVRAKPCATHPQFKLLALSACALLSGARSHHDIDRYMRSLKPAELERLRLSPAKLPSRWTVWRVLSRIDAVMFDRHVSDWLADVWQGSAPLPFCNHSGGALPLLTAFRRD